jgi:hypothetical protein
MTFPPIPAEFVDKHHRMKWEYLFDHTGEMRQEIADMGFHISSSNPAVLIEFLLARFPHQVTPDCSLGDISEDGIIFKEMNDWMQTSGLRGVWQLWVVKQNPVFMFENVVDALHFKLRWC